MTAAQAWAAYSATVLGVEVLDADEKFAALAAHEQKAWEAVAACGATVLGTGIIEVLNGSPA